MPPSFQPVRQPAGGEEDFEATQSVGDPAGVRRRERQAEGPVRARVQHPHAAPAGERVGLLQRRTRRAWDWWRLQAQPEPVGVEAERARAPARPLRQRRLRDAAQPPALLRQVSFACR